MAEIVQFKRGKVKINDRLKGAITAAAQKLGKTVTTPEWQRVARKQEQWQSAAWAMHDEIPELHYAVSKIADSLSKCPLYVGIRPDPKGDLIPVDDPMAKVPKNIADYAIEVLATLKSPIGGQSQIIRQAAANTTVAGEWYLVEIPGSDDDEWYVCSTDEVKKVGRDGLTVTIDPWGVMPAERVSRAWVPHPRRNQQADSAMRALIMTGESILLVDRRIRSGLRSRLFAGLLLLPNGLRSGTADPASEDAGDGEGQDDPLVVDIHEGLETAIQDEGSASGVVPNTLWGEGEQLQYARLLDLGRQLDPELFTLLDSNMRRMARGMDMPVAAMLGSEDSKFWNAFVATEEFRDAVRPKSNFITETLTQVFLRPGLASFTIDPEWVKALEVGQDLTKLERRPDADADTKFAYEKNELSGTGLRRRLSIPESDAPSDDDLLRRAALTRGNIDGPTTTSILDQELETDWEAPDKNDSDIDATPSDDVVADPPTPNQPGEGEGDTPEVEPSPSTASAAPELPLGEELADIDSILSERLFAAALHTMRRALEKAGNRAKAKVAASYKKQVAGEPAHRIIHLLGPTIIAAAQLSEAELLEGSVGGLRADFDRWASEAQNEALVVALAASPSVPDEQSMGEIRARQGEDRNDAWEWFAAAALVLLSQRMLDGDELKDWEVRTLVRQSLARAGGAEELPPAASATTVIVPPSDNTGGGIAAGPVLMALLAAIGVVLLGWKWKHGSASDPYPAHVALDQEKQSTIEGFAPFSPGDHRGCTCSCIPSLVVLGG